MIQIVVVCLGTLECDKTQINKGQRKILHLKQRGLVSIISTLTIDRLMKYYNDVYLWPEQDDMKNDHPQGH